MGVVASGAAASIGDGAAASGADPGPKARGANAKVESMGEGASASVPNTPASKSRVPVSADISGVASAVVGASLSADQWEGLCVDA